jgi:AcrR family transcriptional regulator
LSRRDRKKEEARARILSAATRLIQRHGIDAVTTRDIAEAADVSHQTLYNYFDSKAAIVLGILRDHMATLNSEVNAIVEAPRRDLMRTLSRLLKAIFDNVERRDRRLWREIIALSFQNAPEFVGPFAGYYEGAQERLSALFSRAQRDGRLASTVDAALLAHSVYVFIEFGFLSYVMQSQTSTRATLARVRAQVRLMVAPYLISSAG